MKIKVNNETGILTLDNKYTIKPHMTMAEIIESNLSELMSDISRRKLKKDFMGNLILKFKDTEEDIFIRLQMLDCLVGVSILVDPCAKSISYHRKSEKEFNKVVLKNDEFMKELFGDSNDKNHRWGVSRLYCAPKTNSIEIQLIYKRNSDINVPNIKDRKSISSYLIDSFLEADMLKICKEEMKFQTVMDEVLENYYALQSDSSEDESCDDEIDIDVLFESLNLEKIDIDNSELDTIDTIEKKEIDEFEEKSDLECTDNDEIDIDSLFESLEPDEIDGDELIEEFYKQESQLKAEGFLEENEVKEIRQDSIKFDIHSGILTIDEKYILKPNMTIDEIRDSNIKNLMEFGNAKNFIDRPVGNVILNSGFINMIIRLEVFNYIRKVFITINLDEKMNAYMSKDNDEYKKVVINNLEFIKKLTGENDINKEYEWGRIRASGTPDIFNTEIVIEYNDIYKETKDIINDDNLDLKVDTEDTDLYMHVLGLNGFKDYEEEIELIRKNNRIYSRRIFHNVDNITDELDDVLHELNKGCYDPTHDPHYQLWNIERFLNKIKDSNLFTQKQITQMNYEFAIKRYTQSSDATFWKYSSEWAEKYVYDENTLYKDLCEIENIDDKIEYLERRSFSIKAINIFKEVFTDNEEVIEPNYLNYIVKNEKYPAKIKKEYKDNIDFLSKYDDGSYESLDKLSWLLEGIKLNISKDDLVYIAENFSFNLALSVIIPWTADYGLDENSKYIFKLGYCYEMGNIQERKDKQHIKEIIELLVDRIKNKKSVSSLAVAIGLDNLGYDEIKELCPSDYSSKEMDAILECMHYGHSKEIINLIKSRINSGRDYKLIADEVRYYRKPDDRLKKLTDILIELDEIDYSRNEIHSLAGAIEDGVSDEIISILKEKIKLGMYDDILSIGLITYNLSLEQISEVSKLELGYNKSKVYMNAISLNLTERQLELIKDTRFDAGSAGVIVESFANGLTYEQVTAFANPKFSLRMLEYFSRAILKGGLSVDCISKLYEKRINDEYGLENVLKYFVEDKVTKEAVNLYADSKLSYSSIYASIVNL